MSKNHSVPDDTWNTLEDNNSPKHNDALCPLFYREYKTNNPSVYDKYGNKYTVEDGTFKKNNKVISQCNEEGFTVIKTGYKGGAAEYHDGHLYTTVRSDQSVLVYRDGTQIEAIPMSEDTKIIVERLHNGKYFALALGVNNIYYFYGWHNRQIVTTVVSAALSQNHSTQIISPKIFVNGNLACVALQTGAQMSSYNFKAFWVKNQSGTLTAFKSPDSFSTTGSIYLNPTTSNITYAFKFNIVQTSSQETRTATKVGDDYIDDATSEVVTFTRGYLPTLVSGNQYRYVVYKVTFTYTLEDGTSGFENYTKTFNSTISLTDTNYPVETLSYTINQNNNVIEIDNNLGYVFDVALINPNVTVILTSPSDFVGGQWTGSIVVPTSSIGVSGAPSGNRTATFVNIIHSYTYGGTEVTPNYFGVKGVMLDDGYFYPIANTAGGEVNTNAFVGYNFKNTITSISSAAMSVAVAGTYVAGGSYYGIAEGTCFDLGYGHFRQVRLANDQNSATTDNYISKYTDAAAKTLVKTIMYDSLADDDLAGVGITFSDKAYSSSTRGINCFSNPTGVKPNIKDAFVPLVNNGYISGISYNSTLLTPWNSIDTEVPFNVGSDYALYRDVNTKEWILVKKENKPVQLWLVEDRYVVMNTTSYDNCYDTRLESIEHFASDWNNRIFIGDDTGSYFNVGYRHYNIATAYNASYKTVGKDSGIATATWPTLMLEYTGVAIFHSFCDEEIKEIELYTSSKIEAPKYVRSYMLIKRGLLNTSAVSTVDADLQYYNVAYPQYDTIYMRRNPSLFAKFIYSGNNQDYILDGNVGYQVLYEGTQPMLLTAATGDIYGMESVFVIQSMPYAVIDDKIYMLTYVNGVFQGMDCIINVKGMKYIGAITSRAFFYSPNNRAIYIFTGDANLTKVKDASAITDIYYITYNTATQTIFMATNDGLYMISDQSSYKQTFYEVQSITFVEDGTSVIVHKQNGKYVATRFYYDDAEGLTTNQVRLNTGLLGAGEHKVFTIDKYNISLFSDQKRNGKITIVSYILQDNGKIQTEESSINIKTTDWDPLFLCKQIDFTPKFNKGVGVGISILSDFAITNITASATVEPNTQAASGGWGI